MADRSAGRGLLTEEQLEQELIARRIVAKGQSEPLLQAFSAGRGDRICAARPVARVSTICGDQAFIDEPLQRWIELSIACLLYTSRCV